jgi:hypothetical protein
MRHPRLLHGAITTVTQAFANIFIQWTLDSTVDPLKISMKCICLGWCCAAKYLQRTVITVVLISRNHERIDDWCSWIIGQPSGVTHALRLVV